MFKYITFIIVSLVILPKFILAIEIKLSPSQKGNDTKEINRSIQELVKTGGGIIKLSSGEFYVEEINLKSNISLVGEGRGVTILKKTSPGYTISISGTEEDPIYNVIVEGIGIKGPDKPLKGQVGIYIFNALRGVIIRNVEIQGMGESGIVSHGNVFGLKIEDSRIAFNRYGYGIVLDKRRYRTNAAKFDNVEVWGNAGGILINNAFNDVLRGVWLENNLGIYPDLEIRDSFGCGIVESYIERNNAGQPLIRIQGSVNTFIHRNIISNHTKALIISKDRRSVKTSIEDNRIKCGNLKEFLKLKTTLKSSNLILR
jgi:hypothetical protein